MIIIPDYRFNPNFIETSTLTPATKLAHGVPLGVFLGSYGNKMALRNIQNDIAKKQILRNLYLHAQIINFINSSDIDRDIFPTINLIVSEGLYRHQSIRPIDGENIKKSDGRLVVYQVINAETGRLDHDKTFDVAEFIKDYFHFEKITLEYDTYNVDNSLTSQILIEMPTVPETFNVRFSYDVETTYNGSLLSKDELVEVMPDEDEECIPTWQKRDQELSVKSKKFGDWPTPEEYTGRNGNIPSNELESIGQGHYLDKDAAKDYKRMVQAALASGVYWSINEGYRDYKEQVRVAIKYGLYSENRIKGISGGAAYPGTSKHGWGLAVDLSSSVGGRFTLGKALKTGDDAYLWLVANAKNYGFKTIAGEPWHWEYFRKVV